MDFDIHYTEEQEAFRAVVRAWLKEHAPTPLPIRSDGRPMEPEALAPIREFRRRLGAQGWLAPSWPREYGGGGLSPAMEPILWEELQRLNLPVPTDDRRWIPALLAWGTRAQRRRYVPPALRGETVTWMGFYEPNSGNDLSSIQTRALQEGAVYRLTGVKGFITDRFVPDHLWVLAVTDPDKPSRFTMGVLIVDAAAAGVRIVDQRVLSGSQRLVYLEDVRVPADSLISGPYMGWEIAHTIREQQRGGAPFRLAEEETIDGVLRFLREERRKG